MKKLFIARHAKAAEKKSGETDFDRKLTHKGREQAHRIGKKLHSLNVSVDLVLSSPAARALETAEILCKETGYKQKNIVTDADIYEASLSDLLSIVRSVDSGHNSVMICGHNPSVTELMLHLCRTSYGNMSKGAVALIHLEINRWNEIGEQTGELIYYESPKELKE